MSHLPIPKYLDVIHPSQVIDFYQNLSIIIIVRGREKELPDERKKFLTNSKISDIINTKRGRKTSQTRKAFIMKKSSLQSLITLLTDTGALPEVKAEIEAELSKGQAKAEANRALYADIHDKVIAVLSSATNPVTAQEIADETEIARGKIVYGLTNYWGEEVVADKSGKTTTYRLA